MSIQKLGWLVGLLALSLLNVSCKEEQITTTDTPGSITRVITDTPLPQNSDAIASVTVSDDIVTPATATPPLQPTVTPIVTLTPPSPLSQFSLLPGPVLLFAYDNQQGYLARTDLTGSLMEEIVLVPRFLDVNQIRVNNLPSWDIGTMFTFMPPAVSPDGQWLLFNSGFYWQLVVMQTNELRPGDFGYGSDRLFFTWSPDSQRFAYLTETHLCIYELANRAVSCPFSGEYRTLVSALWSPTGSHIAIAGGGQVWLLDVVTGQAQAVGVYNALPHGNKIVTWSADGQQLLITSYGDVPSTLFSLTEHLSKPIDLFVRDISPDGHYLLHVFDGNSRAAGVSQANGEHLYTLPPACEESPIQYQSGQNWAWSPDNELLAYITTCDNTLYILQVRSGEILWQRAFPNIDFTVLRWSPDGKYLLLDTNDVISESSPELSPIWKLSADGTGELTTIVEHGFLVDVVSQWNGELTKPQSGLWLFLFSRE